MPGQLRPGQNRWVVLDPEGVAVDGEMKHLHKWNYHRVYHGVMTIASTRRCVCGVCQSKDNNDVYQHTLRGGEICHACSEKVCMREMEAV